MLQITVIIFCIQIPKLEGLLVLMKLDFLILTSLSEITQPHKENKKWHSHPTFDKSRKYVKFPVGINRKAPGPWRSDSHPILSVPAAYILREGSGNAFLFWWWHFTLFQKQTTSLMWRETHTHKKKPGGDSTVCADEEATRGWPNRAMQPSLPLQ